MYMYVRTGTCVHVHVCVTIPVAASEGWALEWAGRRVGEWVGTSGCWREAHKYMYIHTHTHNTLTYTNTH